MAFSTNNVIVNNLPLLNFTPKMRFTQQLLISSDTVTTVQEIVPASAGETIIVHKLMILNNNVAGTINLLSNNVVFFNFPLAASDYKVFNFTPFFMKGSVNNNLQFQKLASTQTVTMYLSWSQLVYS